MSQSQLFLIDAHALCYRSFYAIKGLTNSRGQATNAVFGFVKTLQKILQEYRPEYIAVCFDTKAQTLRAAKFAEYKIQRPQMPDDLIPQIPIIKDVIRAYHIPIFERDGYEADDLIAAIVKKTSGKSKRIKEFVIVSDDKDMFQLLGGPVKIFSIRQDKILDEQAVKEKLGFAPALMADFIALAGDQADNIPGVTGIGEVTARKLLNEYGGLDTILKQAAKVTPEKIGRKLVDQREQAELSKELALLDGNMTLDLNEEDLKVGAPDQRKLFEMFSDLEFRTFAAQMAGSGADNALPEIKVRLAGGKASGDFTAEIKKAGEVVFLLPGRPDDAATLFDNDASRSSCWLCWRKGEAAEISMDSREVLYAVLSDPDIRKITYGLKNQLAAWPDIAALVKGEFFDLMLAGYLILPARSDYSVTVLAWEFLKTAVPAEAGPEVIVAAMRDIAAPLQERLKDEGLWDLLHDVEIPLTFALNRMESEGVKLDVPLLKDLSADCDKKIQALMKDIFKQGGGEFNINSPKQLSQVLFEKLKLPVIKKTKTGNSTNEEVLHRLAEKHPMPAMILEYRQLAKLKSTYIDALPQLIDPKSGRVHATFNQTGAETGRLSSNNPNLQNIPIRTELGRQIRKAFIPFKKDHVLVAADYSQIELRILAHLSGDANLTRAFQEGHDIHNSTAARIFDVEESAVDADMRNSAKRVNFGIIYGMSAFGLSKDLNISQPQAQDFIDRYFLRFPGVKKFMDDTVRLCEKQGYVVTLLNRRRYLPEINSSNAGIQQFAQRQAINTPVQGSAADLIKLAMIRIDTELRSRAMAARMIITVHDELVFDVPAKEMDGLIEMIRDKMENALTLNVPVTVSIKHGPNWLDMTKI